MKNLLLITMLSFVVVFYACRQADKMKPQRPLPVFPPVLSGDRTADTMITGETRALWIFLKALRGRGILFGQQDANLTGVDWKLEDHHSDIRDLTGSEPALYGYELSGVGNESNIDSIPFTLIRDRIIEAFNRGGINTATWHMNNPLTGGTAWDVTEAVRLILPDSILNSLYKSELKDLAGFLGQLKNQNGIMVPVILRPFHESNGNWFWWGRGRCTPAEYKELWHFTVSYLRDSLHVHNILYAYSTDMFESEQQYLERYPGDEWVDIIGSENYWDFQSGSSISNGISQLRILVKMASERNKIAALTECGFNGVPVKNWWTQYLLKSITEDSAARNIVYMMVWRNANRKEYYVPFEGQKSAMDFQTFEKDTFTWFGADLPDVYGLKPDSKDAAGAFR